MKLFSKNLLIYTLAALLMTIVLRSILSHIFINRNFIVINMWAFLYFALLILIGWRLGNPEEKQGGYFNSFFRYHLVTFLSWTVVSVLWFRLGYASEFEDFSHVTIPMLIWGGGIILHFLYLLVFRRATISKAHA